MSEPHTSLDAIPRRIKTLAGADGSKLTLYTDGKVVSSAREWGLDGTSYFLPDEEARQMFAEHNIPYPVEEEAPDPELLYPECPESFADGALMAEAASDSVQSL